jgi:multiple sugar transport system permease protein
MKARASLGATAGSLPLPAQRRGVASAIAALRLTAYYALLAALAAVFLMPFFWMITTALKTDPEVMIYPIRWLPADPQWRNFLVGWTSYPFDLFLRNTTIILVGSLMGELLSAALVAYGFARIRFAGRDVLFMVLLATMMVPPQVTLIPTFILFKYLSWLDTFYPLIVPGWFAPPFYVFLLRQFFLTIPTELEDAARVDGASSLTIWWRMILPLSVPALVSVFIFSFMHHWNDFFGPLIYLSSKENKTLALGLSLFKDEYRTNWTLQMAVATAISLPPLALFFALQRYFVQGIALTGLKG